MPPTPRRILIVRPSALGDVARTVPALVSLQRAFPEAKIDWLVNRPFAEVIAAHPELHEVILFDRSKPTAALSLMSRLRRELYDAVYDLQGLARSGLFTGATLAQRRVGFANAREGAWLAYNRRYHIDATRHAVDRMLALLEADGVERIEDLRLYVPDDAQPWAEQQVRRDRLVALAPTAQWGSKCWPIDRYAELAERIKHHKAGTRMVLLTGPGPREQEHVALLKQSLGDCLLHPHTTVAQMMALIARSALLICNDSAPLHIAVGLNTPTVSLFGPTDPALVGPFGYDKPGSIHTVLRPADAPMLATDYRHHRNNNSLIAQLTVEEVWEAVAKKLSTS
jgi:lipopolysaccharide heptosyltransferase I